MINPTQASILTGRNIWQNEEAGVHISLFPKKFQVLPDILVANGYHVGVTGKGGRPAIGRIRVGLIILPDRVIISIIPCRPPRK